MCSIQFVIKAILSLCVFVAMSSSLLCAESMPTARHILPDALNNNTEELFQESMRWSDYFYDDAQHLLRSPYAINHDAYEKHSSGHYMVRESSWYALGLLLRDQPGDRARAALILDVVLKQQYLTPGERWYGTYRRSSEEPMLTDKSLPWRDYDPNWRHFIGTTFAIILIEYPDRLPAELCTRMYEAIDRSIEGEMREGRLVSSYTNIALMYGFLWDFAAVHHHNAKWMKDSAAWNEKVYQLFAQYGAFNEYNSPTYCGVDLYGLALWRDYGSTLRMRKIGASMEEALWRDLMSYYQPALRNIGGPFDRSYGMDMESYVSVVGVWMRTELDATHAPLPQLEATTDHLADLWFAPHIAILGTEVPADALTRMRLFGDEHLVHQQIDANRSATAWIGKNVVFGGEWTNRTKSVGTGSQFHPATVQWRTPSGEIGWALLTKCAAVDARADKKGLSVDANGPMRWHIHAKGIVAQKVGDSMWDLPGLMVHIASNAKNFSTKTTPDGIDLTYSGGDHMQLTIQEALQ